MHEGGPYRREDVEERTREPAADAAQLDERRREENDERLHEHVPAAHVGELVRERSLELLVP